MYFEIYKKGSLIKRGTSTLNEMSWSNELMSVPSTSLTLPIEYSEYFDGREEIKIFINDKCFWGIVKGITLDKVNEVIELDIDHVISEWEYRQISVNNAVKEKNINVIYKGDTVKEDETRGEGISAGDFSILAREVKNLTSKKIKEKARAMAWSLSTGSPIEITTVDESISTDAGSYNVTFSTKKGTSVTVKCQVEEQVDLGTMKTHADKNAGETIGAYPFSVDVDANMTASKVKQTVQAKAWVYRHKDQSIPVTSITTNFVNQVGTYTVTASTANGTSITVNVRVTSGTGYASVSDPTIIDQLRDIYTDANFAYAGWAVNFQGNSGSELIDYVYSRQNKLEALTKTIELTDDLFWRVRFVDQKVVDIGPFGTKRNYVISVKSSGESNISIVEEPTVEYDFENVINVATVYSEKSDSGMSSLTLREVYNDPSLQKDGFPVVILRSNVNNERNYTKYVTQYPKLAPNNENEFAVLDEESIALEAGNLIEDSFDFNDLGAFNTQTTETDNQGGRVRDKDRKRAAITVYKAAIRKLKQARRTYRVVLTTEELPYNVNVGDKVRFIYDNSIWNLDACSNYWKKVLAYDDWFYVTSVEYNFDNLGAETDRITLEKYLKVDRDTKNG